MPTLHLSFADWAVLIGYLVTVALIGIFAASKVKGTSHYFLGNRRFGRLVMVAQNFGTGTHADMPVSLAGIVYTTGLSGIWYQWKNLFVTPFYWLMAPLFRRFRRTTMSEVVEDRYGPWMAVLYTAFALGSFSISIGTMLKGAGKVINQATAGSLPVNGIVIGMTMIFILYSFVGGLVATAWTDVLQGFLIIALSFVVIPIGWRVAGGLTGMKATLGPGHFSLVAPHGIGVLFILALTLNGFIGTMAQPYMIAMAGTGKDENACRVGQFYGNLVKRACTVGWAVVGLLTAAIVAKGTFGATRLADPEEAFGFACRHLLFPGGIGLLIACFLAANMAACSACMVDAGAMVTNALYRRYLAPNRTDLHYLWVGRISGVALTAGAVTYSVFLIKEVLYSFLLMETMATFFGVSIFGGVLWRRANRWGALASIVVSLSVNFGGYALAHQRLDYWDPAVFALALVSGIAALITVSLATAREPEAKQDIFFSNLQTPSGEKEGPREPAEVARSGQQLLLVNLLGLRRGAHGFSLFQAYRADLVGLIKGAAMVLALVSLVWLFF